jgi:hypothetical protein
MRLIEYGDEEERRQGLLHDFVSSLFINSEGMIVTVTMAIVSDAVTGEFEEVVLDNIKLLQEDHKQGPQ